MIANTPSPSPRELVVIVSSEDRLRLTDEGLISDDEKAEVKPLNDFIRRENLDIQSLFDVSEEWMDKRAYLKDIQMGVGQPMDLSIFYKITAPDERLESIADGLRDFRVVQSAYVKPGVELPYIERVNETWEALAASISTNDFTDRQIYLKPAEAGIDAEYAWNINGGKGEDINIIDVEGGWNFLHEDLVVNPSDIVGGVSVSDMKWRRHGTAVLGMLGGDHNRIGISGICPKAKVNTVSVFGAANRSPAENWSSAKAIQCAADQLSQGDIMLIELHQPGVVAGFEENDLDTNGYIPVEWWPCNLTAIKYAIYGRGIIVVEAGGNGRQNLCDDIYNLPPPNVQFPPWWSNPFKRDQIDSGAIVVGAGLPPPENPNNIFKRDRSRWDLSNYGKMINAQGWCEKVATTGGANDLNGGAEENAWYTGAFNGTSSATAMVAGALACLQGILKARGEPLTPAKARELISDNNLGSPQQDGTVNLISEHIGPRPNLRKLIEHLISPT